MNLQAIGFILRLLPFIIIYIYETLTRKKMSRFIDSLPNKEDIIYNYAELAVKEYSVTGGVRSTCGGTETLSVLAMAVAFGWSHCLTEEDFENIVWEEVEAWGGARPPHSPK